MRRLSRGLFSHAVSWALSLVLAVGSVLQGGVAFAEPPASTPVDPGGPPEIVRELVESRTPFTREYELSNGNTRVQYFSSAINYLDDESGTYEPIDVSLETQTRAGGSVRVNKANSFMLSLPSDLSRGWVSIEESGTTLAMRPSTQGRAGQVNVPAGQMIAQSRAATDVAYPTAFEGATLDYESIPEGLKESIVIAEPGEDHVFSFDLRLDGLRPVLEDDGSLSLISIEASAPVMSIPAPFMFDSGDALAEDTYSDGVTYELSEKGSNYVLDVVADEEWLSAADREYPVTIDPTVITLSHVLTDGNETYISSKYQTTSYLNSRFIWINNHDPAANWTEYGYVQPYGTLISGMATYKAQGKYVVESTLHMYHSSLYVAVPGTIYTRMCDTSEYLYLPNLTWATYAAGLGTAVSSFAAPNMTVTASSGWSNFDVTSMVANWQNIGVSQQYTTARFTGSTSAHIGYYSSNTSNSTSVRPWWEIDFATAPSVDITNPSGGTLVSVPTATWTYSDVLNNPQAQWAMEVATSPTGPIIATAGASNALTTASIPAPSGGFVPGTTYYVHVKAATSPSTQVPRLWGDWSDWASFTPVLPGEMGDVSFETTASEQWFQEVDTNSDWINDARDDNNSSGRGSVALSWESVDGATSYDISLFDGNTYRKVGSTDSTSWSTAGKGLYPSDTAISALADNTSTSPWLAGTGLDLRDDPRPLYAKTTGTDVDDVCGYLFQVEARNAYGVNANGPSTVRVALEGRTEKVNAEERHTYHNIGEVLGHIASAELDTGALTLDVTDLSIASWGPVASLGRHYSSESTATGRFASGWVFNFDQRVDVTTSTATWTDSQGKSHVFHQVDGDWVAPTGLRAELSQTLGDWKLTFADQSSLTFDGFTGYVESEADFMGNAVTYTRSEGGVAIGAANGQRIDVALDQYGQVTSAVYATADGTRTVDYSGLSSTQAQATYFSGTPDEFDRVYTYGGSGHEVDRLVRVAVPDFEWSDLSGDAWWSFGYDANAKLDGWNRLHADTWGASTDSQIAYSGNQATVREYPDGSAISTLYEWNSDGSTAWNSNPGASGERWSYTYLVDGDQLTETSPLGATSSNVFDAAGNVIESRDARGAVTISEYDDDNRIVRSIDPLGSETSYVYNVDGTLDSRSQVLNAAGECALTEYDYDAYGRVTAETVKLNSTDWAQTTYTDFASNGEAQRVTSHDVVLVWGESSQDTSSTKDFDEFGNLVWEKDATGRWVTQENAYSASGRLASSVGAAGELTTYSYNELGGLKESKTTAGSVVGDWTTEVRDATGAVVNTARRDEDGDMRTAVVNTMDDLSRVTEKTEYVDLVSWSVTTYEYDSSGRVIEECDGLSAVPRTTTYDAEGREKVVLEPGATPSEATTTTYDAVGNTTRVDNPDGTWSSATYDLGGNVLAEITPTESGELTKGYVYDLASRRIESSEASTTTQVTYDLASRPVSSGIVGAVGSSTEYNSLNWEIKRTDSDGIVTMTSYDAAGRVVSVSVAGEVTSTCYDVAGRVESVTEPDGRCVHQAYDALSRPVREWHTIGAETVKDTQATYDWMSRPIETSETVGAIRRNATYGVDSKLSSMTSRYEGLTSAVTMARQTGLEDEREVTGDATQITRTLDRDEQNRVTDVVLDTTSVAASIGYDANGKVISQAGLGYGEDGAEYTYGDSGLKTSESVNLAYDDSLLNYTYEYTEDGRLKSFNDSVYETEYHYDSSGNIVWARPEYLPGVEAALTYDSANRLITFGTTHFGWDTEHGWRTSVRHSGDSSITLSYTDSGRLATYVDPNEGVDASYSYDGYGQRTQSVVTEGSITTTSTYLYDDLSLLAVQGQGSDGTSQTLVFDFDEDGRPWMAEYRAAGSVDATTVLVVTNDRGDVIELLDETGGPFAKYGYDAWGNPIARLTATQASGLIDSTLAAEIASFNPLRYAGYAYDDHSGMYYCSQRYYDPATFQFITKDPARAEGEESAYQYCAGNPINQVDPSGLWSMSLPGIRLYVTYLYHYHVERLLYRPGGAPTGTYLSDKKVYSVRLRIHKAYMWAYTGLSLVRLGLKYAAVQGSRRFLLTSSARRACYQNAVRRARLWILGSSLAKGVASNLVTSVATAMGYVTEEKYWIQIQFPVIVTSRGKLLKKA